MFSVGVGGRGRRPLESADPRGPACGATEGFFQGVLGTKKTYPRRVAPAATGQTLAPWGPSAGSGTGSGDVFGPHRVQTRKSLFSLRKRKGFEGSAGPPGDPKSVPRGAWGTSEASSWSLGSPSRVLGVIVGVVGGPLGLDFVHFGPPGTSLGLDFYHFRIPRTASGAKICDFIIQHFNFPKRRQLGAAP